MTAVAAVRGPVDQLAPICLEDLVTQASLQTRIDRKYLLPAAGVDGLLRAAIGEVRVLQIGDLRTFAYESVYFDTTDLLIYHLAAHRRRRRFKVRTRTYLDSAECWLEVKTRGQRGRTVKDRAPHDVTRPDDVSPGAAHVAGVLGGAGIAGAAALQLRPTLVTRYLRTTLFLPSSCSRVTIDTQLTWDDGTRSVAVPHLAVVETKTGACASAMDRALWVLGARPVRFSKYGTGLATLQPGLPSTPWRRTLGRHVLPFLDDDCPTDRETRTSPCHA